MEGGGLGGIGGAAPQQPLTPPIPQAPPPPSPHPPGWVPPVRSPRDPELIAQDDPRHVTSWPKRPQTGRKGAKSAPMKHHRTPKRVHHKGRSPRNPVRDPMLKRNHSRSPRGHSPTRGQSPGRSPTRHSPSRSPTRGGSRSPNRSHTSQGSHNRSTRPGSRSPHGGHR